MKGLDTIDRKIKESEDNPLRQHVLQCAKEFKTSWIELGRALYSVWKEKNYKEWGYTNFDAYVTKEIGIRKQTGMKLLRSYTFLEKEEPQYLKAEYNESADTAALPSYESVDVLRLAKNNKNLDTQDYAKLKKKVFDEGKDVSEVKQDLTQLIRERKELEPEEALEQRRVSVVRRFLGTLKAIKQEAQVGKLISPPLLKEVEALIRKVELELEENS
jgi:hypothetical protein